jgi:phosphate transport system permease protein
MTDTLAKEKWRKKRHRAEQRFKWYGRAALGTALLLVVLLIGSIVRNGYLGFTQTQLRLEVTFDAALLELDASVPLEDTPPSSYLLLSRAAIKQAFPEVTERKDKRALSALLSVGVGAKLRHALLAEPELLGQTKEFWLPASSMVDGYIKRGHDAKISEQQVAWLEQLKQKGAVRTEMNTRFFTAGDSRTPEQAGFLGAVLGSLYTLAVCVGVAFPLGVMTAVYLEEFARKGRWVDLIEVNINNLAAVPSIVFGLLGLAVYINLLGMPRSAPLVGGLTLALMILPVIIIATRAALASIPSSIRDAARGLGASPVQVVWHHVLPLSMPGIMTGTILGMARAIGETAPLIMIGMVAFVADLPNGFESAATVMPVQIFLWANSPEAGFVEKTAAAILSLLVILLSLNALAIYLRKRFEVRW